MQINDLLFNFLNTEENKNENKTDLNIYSGYVVDEATAHILQATEKELTKTVETVEPLIDSLKLIIELQKSLTEKTESEITLESESFESIKFTGTEINTYKDLIKYAFTKMFSDETVNDPTVISFCESLLSIADNLIEQNLLPKHIKLTTEQADLLFAKIKSQALAEKPYIEVHNFISQTLEENAPNLESEMINDVVNSVVVYHSILDVLFNTKDMMQQNPDLLMVYVSDRDMLFDYLVGKYLVKHGSILD